MVKHTLTIRRVLPTNYLSVFDHFMGLAFKWLSFINYFSEMQKNSRCIALMNVPYRVPKTFVKKTSA